MNASEEYVLTSTNPAEWAETLSKTFGGLELKAYTPNHFKATMRIRTMANLNLAMVDSTPARVWHDGAAHSFSERERFLVKTQLVGSSRINVGEVCACLSEGDFLICDNARSYSLEFDESTEILSIPIPEKLLGRFHAHPEDLAFIRADRRVAANQVISDFIKSLWASRTLEDTPLQAKRLRDTYFDLLVMGFENVDVNRKHISTVQADHLERCKNYIDAHYEDENLDVDMISSNCLISKRYLHSIFSVSGMSVSNYIIAVRLDHSAQMLRSRRFQQFSVSEIAYECGFKSSAHFARVFRARFNEPPSIYRKQTLQ
jgi:AraC-like DNA-binding protein